MAEPRLISDKVKDVLSLILEGRLDEEQGINLLKGQEYTAVQLREGVVKACHELCIETCKEDEAGDGEVVEMPVSGDAKPVSDKAADKPAKAAAK